MPRLIEIFWQMTVGGVTSVTVTVAVHVEKLPLTSVTVNVTVLAPTFEQLKDEGDTLIEAIPQLSLEPLLICEAVIFTTPAEFRFTEMFWQSAVGAILS